MLQLLYSPLQWFSCMSCVSRSALGPLCLVLRCLGFRVLIPNFSAWMYVFRENISDLFCLRWRRKWYLILGFGSGRSYHTKKPIDITAQGWLFILKSITQVVCLEGILFVIIWRSWNSVRVWINKLFWLFHSPPSSTICGKLAYIVQVGR